MARTWRRRQAADRGTSRSYAPGVQYRVLGQLEVLRDGAALDLGSPKQRVLLAALLLERGRLVPTTRLLDLLWGEDPPAAAEAGLQAYVSKLRRVLEPAREQRTAPSVLVTRGAGYALLVDDAQVDAHAFAGLAAAATAAWREQRWDASAVLARQALALHRGPLLPEMSELPFRLAEARRIDALEAACREALVVSSLARGHTTEAVAEAERWCESAPDDERALWLLVLSLHRAGRTTVALSRLRAYQEQLGELTGLDMGRDLEDLLRAVLAQDPTLERWPAGPADPAPAAAVPAQRSSGETDLVGREQETALLVAAVDRAAVATQWLVLTGPAGIGKTSLASVAAARAGRAVWARCPDDNVPAWWPLRQVVRGLGGSPDEVLVPDRGTEADAARFAVYERLSDTLLSARPSAGSLVVVVDDVQWADDASLAYLTYLAQTVDAPHTAVVLTLRDDEAPRDTVAKLLATLARRSDTQWVAVPALTSAAVAGLVARLTGEQLEPARAALLALRTGGNPLFVGEYARLPDGDRRDGAVPVAARQLLDRRLARLDPQVQSVLRTAAVIGEDFDLHVLAAATQLSMESLVECLDRAIAAHVLVEDRAGGTAYAFAHGLLRDAVLASVTAPRRQLLHRSVADVLLPARDSESLARRAGHLLAAGPVADPAQVREACAAVAADADGRQDAAVAAQWWESALSVPAPPAEQLQDELRAVRALAAAGRPDRAVARVEQAFTCALERADLAGAAALADELLHVQDGWMWTVMGEPRPPLLDRLLEALDRTAEPRERVPLLGAVAAGMHNVLGPLDARLPFVDEAARLAEQTGDPDLLMSAYGSTLKALMHIPSGIDRTRVALDRHAAAAQGVRDRRTVMELQCRTDLLLLTGEVSASLALHERTTALSDALRLPGFRAQARWASTRYAQWSGDEEHAEALLERALQLHLQTGVQYAAGANAQSLLALRRLQGRAAEVPVEHLEHTRGFNHDLWLVVRACEVGDLGRARDLLRGVPLPQEQFWGTLSTLVLLAHAVCDTGTVERAPELLRELEPCAGLVASFGHFGCAGPVDLALGRLLLLSGRREEGLARLRDARDHAEREGGAPFVRQADALLSAERV